MEAKFELAFLGLRCRSPLLGACVAAMRLAPAWIVLIPSDAQNADSPSALQL